MGRVVNTVLPVLFVVCHHMAIRRGTDVHLAA
jgi:hypothetical protein